MVPLTRNFSAIADLTRRAILARLASGETSVSELAEPFDISLPAISRHLKVLERRNRNQRPTPRRGYAWRHHPRRSAMSSKPSFVNRPEQPYAAIRLSLEMVQVPQLAPPLIGEIIAWVAEHGQQAGPVFFNYTKMDGSRMDMEVGVPTTAMLAADERVTTGTLPAGRYAVAIHTGPYDQLRAAHEKLHEWLAQQNLPPQGMNGGRSTLLEIYHSDPAEEPDPHQWVTEIAFKIED